MARLTDFEEFVEFSLKGSGRVWDQDSVPGEVAEPRSPAVYSYESQSMPVTVL